MKSKYLIAIAITLMLFACSGESNTEREDIPVTVYVVESSMISQVVQSPCRLEAGSEAVISVSVSGVVEEVLVTAGDTVTAGQRLLALRTDDMQRALVSDAAAMIAATRASSEYASTNLERASELLETGAMSAGVFDRIQTEAVAAEATYQQAVAGYNASSTSARNRFVLAPFSGVVGRVIVTEGNLSDGPLMSISGTGVIKAELLLAPRHINKLRVGLPVVFTTDHFPGRAFPGSVVSVSESADMVSGLVALSVQFTDTTGSLVPGLSGMTMVSLETKEDVVVLPGNMMTFVSEEQMEIVLLMNGKASKQIVETGIRNGISYEITSGLAPGDSVINLGHTIVSDGAQVRVVR